jgi:Cu(I)/Ag(I) efflux system membrane protein CusA/SilA
MINRILTWSLHHRFARHQRFSRPVRLGVVCSSACRSTRSPISRRIKLIVYADWPGRSPQEVEDQITYPLSALLQGLAGVVQSVRATSMFGFSFLTVVFEDRIGPYFARTRVLEVG